MKTPILLALIALSVFVPTMVLAQSLQSGALLSIQSADGSLNLAVYDSQIHSGNVQADPCDGGLLTSLQTDAYVLQGGSPTGCDNGDSYETSQTPGMYEFAGSGYKFDVKTFYQFNWCNTSGTICANPDTGFLTVTNNGTSNFSGTITLSGSSLLATQGYCATGGTALDTWTSGLAANGGSVTLALGTPNVENPYNSDSSNCGGFNAPQTQTLTAGSTAIFPVGTDDYELAAIDNAGGEQITMLPIPVLQTSSEPGSNQYNTFNPGTMFPAFSCSPYGDFNESTANLECVEFQVTCSGASDCEQFLYTATTHYSFPTGFPGIGGPGFLKASGQSCPPPLQAPFDQNIFSFYTQDTTHQGGGGGLSCLVAAYNPKDQIVTTFKSFDGFEFPFSDTRLNYIISGLPAPLSWDYEAPNLTVCPNATGNGCTAPWVYPSSIQIACPGGQPVPPNPTPISVTRLLNFGQGENGITEYFFFWITPRHAKGCTSVVMTFDSGLIEVPAQFKYIF